MNKYYVNKACCKMSWLEKYKPVVKIYNITMERDLVYVL